MTFTEGITAIAANHPYLIKVTTGLTEFTVDGVTIEPNRAGGSFDDVYVLVTNADSKNGYFRGTYMVKALPVNSLFLNDNTLWFCTGSNTMKAFRAYFELEGVQYTDGARLAISFDDSSLTGITETNCDNHSDEIFNLQGQHVTSPTKGIYIKNGKKTIIK